MLAGGRCRCTRCAHCAASDDSASAVVAQPSSGLFNFQGAPCIWPIKHRSRSLYRRSSGFKADPCCCRTYVGDLDGAGASVCGRERVLTWWAQQPRPVSPHQRGHFALPDPTVEQLVLDHAHKLQRPRRRPTCMGKPWKSHVSGAGESSDHSPDCKSKPHRTVDITVARHRGCSRRESMTQLSRARRCMSLSLGCCTGGGPCQ